MKQARTSCLARVCPFTYLLYLLIHFPFNDTARFSFLQLSGNLQSGCLDRFEVQAVVAVFLHAVFIEGFYFLPTVAVFVIQFPAGRNPVITIVMIEI